MGAREDHNAEVERLIADPAGYQPRAAEEPTVSAPGGYEGVSGDVARHRKPRNWNRIWWALGLLAGVGFIVLLAVAR